MFSPSATIRALRIVLPVLFSLVFAQPSAHAWGNEGHHLVNRLAVATRPSDTPGFLRSQAAADEIEYLGSEPDRWRSKVEPELNAAQAPEHFINMELADALGPLPHKRLDFETKFFVASQRPETIGRVARVSGCKLTTNGGCPGSRF
jgi:hypothetical protein